MLRRAMLILLIAAFSLLLGACGAESEEGKASQEKNDQTGKKETDKVKNDEDDEKDKEMKSAEEAVASEETMVDDHKKFAEEAGQYVDALIQTTVFQNEEHFVATDPSPRSEEKKLDEAIFQKETFVSFYVENTKKNYASLGVDLPQEILDEMGANFMKALAQTKYRITDTRHSEEDNYKVTLSVEGFNHAALQDEATLPFMADYQAGKITVEELVMKQSKRLSELYTKPLTLKPSTAYVDVLRNSDGSYAVLLQDQYLLSFAQPQ